MILAVTTDLSGAITSTKLRSMWVDATVPSVALSDLDDGFTTVFVATSWSDVAVSLASPRAGQLFWHQQHQLMYCYHDAIDVLDSGDKTAVSLWLCVGPDCFETACLAYEPIPAGAVVEPVYDRWVRVFRPDAGLFSGETLAPAPLGVNQSGIEDDYGPRTSYDTTSASGAWIRVGIDGYVRAWHPVAGSDVGATGPHVFPVRLNQTHFNFMGALPTVFPEKYMGSLVGNVNTNWSAGPWTLAQTIHHFTVPSGYSAVYPWVRWMGTGVVNYQRG